VSKPRKKSLGRGFRAVQIQAVSPTNINRDIFIDRQFLVSFTKGHGNETIM
jgi:hypothetical protein